MGLKDLDGNRTGRSRGSKSAPRWTRDLKWVYRHLGEDVEPPTSGAKFWRGVAQEQPDKFAAALAQLDQASQRMSEASVPATVADSRPESGAVPAITRVAQKPQRVKLAFLSLDHLTKLLAGGLRAADIQGDARVIACSLDRERRGLVLTLCSRDFPLVREGQLISQMELQFSSGR
jgi:hypothetical protein